MRLLLMHLERLQSQNASWFGFFFKNSSKKNVKENPSLDVKAITTPQTGLTQTGFSSQN